MDIITLNHAEDPKPVNGVYPVGLVYDRMDSRVELQVLRDVITLSQKWNIAVNDAGGNVNLELLRLSGVELTDDEPVLYLVYKTGEEWPYSEPGVQVVRRDLQIKKADTHMNPNPEVGYFLRPQGRDGANLTELYLNRTAPRGNGLSNALVVLLWGN